MMAERKIGAKEQRLRELREERFAKRRVKPTTTTELRAKIAEVKLKPKKAKKKR